MIDSALLPLNDNTLPGPTISRAATLTDQSRPKPEGYSYGTVYDRDGPFPYFLEWPSNRFVYRLPPCEICGMSMLTYSIGWAGECGACKLGRVEGNEG